MPPDGRLALTADYDADARCDGNADTVTVIDLEASPPRAIDRVTVGDGPDGLALSSTGKVAVAVLVRASYNAKDKWYHHPTSSMAVLKIDGKRVTKVDELELGRVAEGVAFSPDGKYLYVANFLDRSVCIFKVNGTSIIDTGKRLQLKGKPTAMRVRSR